MRVSKSKVKRFEEVIHGCENQVIFRKGAVQKNGLDTAECKTFQSGDDVGDLDMIVLKSSRLAGEEVLQLFLSQQTWAHQVNEGQGVMLYFGGSGNMGWAEAG